MNAPDCISLPLGQPVSPPARTVLCLGNFDGVHLAHRELIRQARALRDEAFPDAVCGVFCFRELSSDLLSEEPPEHLTSFEERMALFAEAGAEIVFLADFPSVRELSPEQFAKEILLRDCRCAAAVCGFNYRFGKNAVGTAESLKELLGVPVAICPPVLSGGEPISSTRIRALLKAGEAEQAAALLGRPYSITSEVLSGKKLGRRLGFPTVNQAFPRNRLLPRRGVYVTDCLVGDTVYRGVSNVGTHPTVDGSGTPINCETHLLGYSGDLYGSVVTVRFLHFLREERRFGTVEELREQILRDAETARRF